MILVNSGGEQSTRRLSEATGIARELALVDGRIIDVRDLATAVVYHPDSSCRARLVLRRLGAYRRISDDDSESEVAAAMSRSHRPSASISAAENTLTVLNQVPYWAERTGDRNPDTVHLLLACLAYDANVVQLRDAGITVSDVIRAAMAVRRNVSPLDRQFGDRGAIPSTARPDVPTPYFFKNQELPEAGALGYGDAMSRSQVPGVAHTSSRVQGHLLQWHMWLDMAALVTAVLLPLGAVYAAFTSSVWSLLWLAGQLRRSDAGLGLRLGGDLALIVVTIVLGLPWFLPILAIANRIIDVIEGRLGLLHAKADTADVTLTEKSIRSDRRINLRAANTELISRITGGVNRE
ncbi:hypothetical protein [Nocardia sp. NPDC058705]|uniref:hypothetical protein n=1 Tax=Nocardia sp. NPDC058705 TaxID=3346609 RepID=UPI0036A8BE58